MDDLDKLSNIRKSTVNGTVYFSIVDVVNVVFVYNNVSRAKKYWYKTKNNIKYSIIGEIDNLFIKY